MSSLRDRLRGVAAYLSDEADDDDALALGTDLATAAVAAAIVLPLAWLLIPVVDLGSRALTLTVAPQTIAVLLRSVALVAVVTAGSVVVGVPLAVVTVQGDIPFGRFWTVVAALPLAVPSYLGAFAAVSAFGPRGLLASLLGPEIGRLVPTVTGFWGAALVLTLYTYPYVFLTTRASLLSLDGALVDAARSLDAGRLRTFWRVTLPQILPAIAAGALLVALYTLADFGTPNIMRVEVFTQFIFARYNAFMRDYAALLSIQLLAVTAVVLAIESRIGVDESAAYGNRGGASPVDLALGPWRYVAPLLPAIVGAVAILTPVAIFGLWLVRTGPGYAAGGGGFTWVYATNSVLLAGAAAVVAVLVALPIGVRSALSNGRLAQLADRLSYLGYATPGIVVAIALVGFSLEILPAIYKTAPLLVFAYVVRFLPQAVGSIRTSTLQVDERLTEASRTLGHSRLSSFRRVTLPLIAPGVASGGALVFLTAMKELPATLLLSPIRTTTLVTYIWEVEEAGAYGQAAIPALVLVVVSGVSMGVILYQEGGLAAPE